MSTTVVVGCQWGDEGKGKLVDILSSQADLVVRYQGGDNAGHTVIHDGQTFRLHLIPSGVLCPGVMCILADGMVINPRMLLEEMAGFREKNMDLSGLRISANAHLIMPYHITLDKAREERLGKTQIGTTCRGIGPAYMDKAARSGIRADALLDDDILERAIRTALEEKNLLLEKVYGQPPLKAEPIIESYAECGRLLRDHIADTSRIIHDAIADGRRVLFESAQGALLDINHGTYPYVTSSNTTAGGASIGSGIGPTAIDGVLGVVKAYTTRVGNGPLPTEALGEGGEALQRIGGEFGAVTGRPRRCGWFDANVVRYSVRVNGLTGLAVTKLDVLDSFSDIPVGTAYRVDGELSGELPAEVERLERVEPVYEVLPGWMKSTEGARRMADLPAQARAYLDRLQDLAGAPIRYVSVGTRRDQIIEV